MQILIHNDVYAPIERPCCCVDFAYCLDIKSTRTTPPTNRPLRAQHLWVAICHHHIYIVLARVSSLLSVCVCVGLRKAHIIIRKICKLEPTCATHSFCVVPSIWLSAPPHIEIFESQRNDFAQTTVVRHTTSTTTTTHMAARYDPGILYICHFIEADVCIQMIRLWAARTCDRARGAQRRQKRDIYIYIEMSSMYVETNWKAWYVHK